MERRHASRRDSTPAALLSLIGGTHNDRVRFWEEGGIATEGIRRMAELGSQTPLDQEVTAAISAGNAQQALRGGGIDPSPGEASIEFEISRDFPRVTLVSMLAPSPDWFVGVSALSLLENNDWVAERTIELFPYDAGTDRGRTYLSPDQVTNPRQPITRINSRPLLVGGVVPPVGTFTFRRR
jgi:hypothetical protein